MEGDSNLNSGALKVGGRFTVEAVRDGQRLWKESFDNIVVNEGIQAALDSGIVGSTWYVGLLGNYTPVAGSTLAALTEVTAYTEGARQVWTKTRSAQTVSNSASVASFTINADSTVVYGAFLASANSGTVGTMLAGAQFGGGAKTLDTNDVLNITYEITGSSS